MSYLDDASRHVYPEFAGNAAFGVSTGIERLDLLLHGGLLIEDKARMLVLMQGGMGTGKTTLALQIASASARQAQTYLLCLLGARPW